MKSVSYEDVLGIAQDNHGQVTAGKLARETQLTYVQAMLKLQCLFEKGYFSMAFGNFTEVYVVKPARIPLGLNAKARKRTKLTDAEVIKAVMETGGKITPTALCVALECSLEDARNKLEELQLQDVFDLEVTNEGTVLYVLNDMEWFEDSKVKKIKA